jgi:hypothetical protein
VKTSVFQQVGRSVWARSGLSGKVTGSGNTFASRQPEGKIGLYQLLQLGNLASPTALSSASMIAPHFNYNVYTVNGTAQINYIKVGGTDVTDSMSAGRITLISKGWSLSNSGNIRPRTTARRAVGALVVLAHDPATRLWIEQ